VGAWFVDRSAHHQAGLAGPALGVPPLAGAAPLAPVPAPAPGDALAIAAIGGPLGIAESAAAAIPAASGWPPVTLYHDAAALLTAGDAPALQVILVEAGPAAESTLEELRRVLPAHVPRRVLLAPGIDAELVGLALEQRVDGVVLATYPPADLVSALRHIGGGRAVFPEGWQELMATHVPRASAIPELSDRQRQVLDLLARGRRNDEIADELLLSPNTVKFHVRAIFSRLGVRNRAEASELLARIDRDDA